MTAPLAETYDQIAWPDIDQYKQKFFEAMDGHLTRRLEELEDMRSERWNYDTSSLAAYENSIVPNRRSWHNFLGWPVAQSPLKVRVEPLAEYSAFRVDRIHLLVQEDIVMDSLLLSPHGTAKRGAVICQHGLDATPEEMCGFAGGRQSALYNSCGIRLAEAGFVVLAPRQAGGFGKPESTQRFIGGKPETEQFRARTWLHRKAAALAVNLLGMELFHLSRAVDYLASLPLVDPARIGFYGLSQGGQSALWYAAADTRIKATVCAAYFSHRMPTCYTPGGDRYTAYIDTFEEDKFPWGQLLEFSDWQIMSLICPRAFMVEVGKKDDSARWEMVVDEFHRGKALYERLGISHKAQLCLHPGGHECRCLESLDFLLEHLAADPLENISYQ